MRERRVAHRAVVSAAVAIAAAATFATFAVRAKPVVYELPEETSDFKPGPGVEVARAHCLACHSADYVSTQPRGKRFGRDFWEAAVTKMIKVHGAPITPEEAETIVAYLSKTYR